MSLAGLEWEGFFNRQMTGDDAWILRDAVPRYGAPVKRSFGESHRVNKVMLLQYFYVGRI
jgi:hypothetical protein